MRMRRITMRGEAQIRRGHRWVILKTSQLNPAKIKRWLELRQRQKEVKE